MEDYKTVFVLGAGASAEAKLPVGDGLKRLIASALGFRWQNRELLEGSEELYYAIDALAAKLHHRNGRGAGNNRSTLHQSAARMRAAMPLAPSIDHYLHTHGHDEGIVACGKLCIAALILESERASLLMPIRDESVAVHEFVAFSSLEKTWFAVLFRLLSEQCDLDRFVERLKAIAVVSFNYDRCFEHFLRSALEAYFHIDASKSAEIVSKIVIYHAYGYVGPLSEVRFGAQVSPNALVEIGERLQTFTEVVDESHDTIVAIRKVMSEADRLVFLGNAFHKLNMDLLLPLRDDAAKPVDHRQVFATAYEISDSNVQLITEDLGRRLRFPLNQRTLRSDLTCAALFNEFSRLLSA